MKGVNFNVKKKYILKIIKDNILWLALLILLNVCIGFIPLLNIYINSMLLDSIMAVTYDQKEFGILVRAVTFVFLMLIVRYLFGLFREIIEFIIYKYLKETILLDVANKQERLEYKIIENDKFNNLIMRLTTEPGIDQLIDMIHKLSDLIICMINIISIIVLSLTINIVFSISILFSCIPIFLVSIKKYAKLYQTNKDIALINRKSRYLEFEMLRGRDLAAERNLYSYTNYYNKKFGKYFKKTIDIPKKVKEKWLLLENLFNLIQILFCLFLLTYMVKNMSMLSLSYGYIFSYITTIFQIEGNIIDKIPSLIGDVVTGLSYIKELNRYFRFTEENDFSVDKEKFKIDKIENIEFKDVSFKYPDANNFVLKNISFVISSGKHYALIGKNGCGKSTIVKLLLKFYSPTEGKILINGIDIELISQENIYNLFSVVFQDFARYQLTVRENILLGSPTKKLDIESVIEQVNLKELNNLPNGLDTFLGKIYENGIDLSGGQWQKIAIARSLVRKSQLRILDEPTASLDPLEESRLYQDYQSLLLGNTAILITHRLGATKLVDKIIVIDEGTVKEIGSHDELMKKNDLYFRMFNSQKGWYDE